MECLGSNPHYFFLLLFVVSPPCSSFFTVSHGIEHLPHLQPLMLLPEYGNAHDAHVIWKRSIVETAHASSLVLSAARTYRKDPSNGFKPYTGGWNITDQRYWNSVGFTAVPLLIVATVWFALFGLSLFFICLYHCCCRRESKNYSYTAYALSLILLTLFTIAAVVGCGFLYNGQGKFYKNTNNTLTFVVHQADNTVDNLKSISGYLSDAKRVGVGHAFLAQNVQSNIDDIQNKINMSANTLSVQTKQNSEIMIRVLDIWKHVIVVVAAAMLVLVFSGFLHSILGLHRLVYMMMIIGWFLVTVAFVLSGFFLLLHNVTLDTCVAMDEWVQNPTAHTALDDILPCVDNVTAQESLLQSKDVTFQLVQSVNSVINNVSNLNVPPQVGLPLFFNQTGPLVPNVCNPFNSDLTDVQCTDDEAHLSNATEVWRRYICEEDRNTGLCTTPGRLTRESYEQMSGAVNASYGLYRYGPFLVDLEGCGFLRYTFTRISHDHCPGLGRYTKRIYLSLVVISATVMPLLVLWIIHASQRRRRKFPSGMARLTPGENSDKL